MADPFLYKNMGDLNGEDIRALADTTGTTYSGVKAFNDAIGTVKGWFSWW